MSFAQPSPRDEDGSTVRERMEPDVKTFDGHPFFARKVLRLRAIMAGSVR
jgi:hypothetical protein